MRISWPACLIHDRWYPSRQHQRLQKRIGCNGCNGCIESWLSWPKVQHFCLPQLCNIDRIIINKVNSKPNGLFFLPFSSEVDICEPAAITTKGHRLVLEVAFTTLITNRAIKWMVDQKELHDSFTGLASHVWICFDLPSLHDGHGTSSNRLGRPFNFNQTHSTVSSNWKPVMIAKTWDFNSHHSSCL